MNLPEKRIAALLCKIFAIDQINRVIELLQ